MANDLTITSGGGSQTSTGNPQTATSQSGGPSTSSGGVQPGTTNKLLESSTGGVPLGNQALTTVNLPTAATTTTTAVTTKPAPHKASPALIGLTVALFVVAVIVFWAINRSAKSTTNYQ